jgi:cell division protein FtsB
MPSIGLSYGEILASLSLISALVAAWIALNARMTTLEANVAELRECRRETDQELKDLRNENKCDHKDIMDKLEQFMLGMKKVQPTKK